MTSQFTIRGYQPQDQPAIEALEQRVQPYRPEDMTEVSAMRARANGARASGVGWSPHVAEPDDIRDVKRWYAGFWVAVTAGGIVGMVGVRRQFARGAAPPRDRWHLRDDIAELRRLRVAPEARRMGIGSALTRAVIEWCRADGRRVLYLHTTSAQLPAIALYDRLGFRDIGHRYTGEWEYVWYEMRL